MQHLGRADAVENVGAGEPFPHFWPICSGSASPAEMHRRNGARALGGFACCATMQQGGESVGTPQKIVG